MKQIEVLATAITLTLLIPVQVYGGTAVWESATDYLVTSNDPLAFKQYEPHLAVRCCSSTNANTIIAGNNDKYAENCQIYRSTDGGKNWILRFNLAKVFNGDGMIDPSVTSPNNGYFYYACLEWPATVGGTSYIIVARSIDGGSTWTQAVAVGGTANQIDKPWIASDPNSASPYKNRVYLCWSDLTTNTIRFKKYVPFDSDDQAVSIDLGISGTVHGCYIAIGPQGQIYVVYQKKGFDGTNTIQMRRNLYGGDPVQWQPPIGQAPYDGYIVGTWAKFTNMCPGTGFECLKGYNGVGFRVSHFPSATTDSNGGVHVTWTSYQGTGTLGNIMYANSNSCKSTSDTCTGWGTLFKVNSDTAAADQWEPAIIVSKSGNIVHITAYDRREDSGNVLYKPYNYHCHYNLSTGVNCLTLSQWRDSPNGGQVAISNSLSTNVDQDWIIDDYHGIATSPVRQAYTAWTDHREVTAGDYDIRADRTTT